jgi:hypothetical protein
MDILGKMSSNGVIYAHFYFSKVIVCSGTYEGARNRAPFGYDCDFGNCVII